MPMLRAGGVMWSVIKGGTALREASIGDALATWLVVVVLDMLDVAQASLERKPAA